MEFALVFRVRVPVTGNPAAEAPQETQRSYGSHDGARSEAQKGPTYTNLTPWVNKLFFAHTYYAYIFVFYLFLLMFYKGYALEYPDWRRPEEMVLIMCIPACQHVRFYFGYWGCEKGLTRDLCIFLFFCTCLLWMLMYFLFCQAYILPLDAMLSLIAVVIVIIEGFCGVINILQSIKLHSQSTAYVLVVVANILVFLATVVAFLSFEISPKYALEEVHRVHASDAQHAAAAVWDTIPIAASAVAK